jgi:acyl carrier protein
MNGIVFGKAENKGQPRMERSRESDIKREISVVLASLWQEVLQMREQPRPTDNFFELGGDSMTMTMVEFRIKEELSVELAAGAVLEAQTLQELSELVERAMGRDE